MFLNQIEPTGQGPGAPGGVSSKSEITAQGTNQDEARQLMAITFLIGLLAGFIIFGVLKLHGGKK